MKRYKYKIYIIFFRTLKKICCQLKYMILDFSVDLVMVVRQQIIDEYKLLL